VFDVEFDVPSGITADAIVSRLADGLKLRRAIEDELAAATFDPAVAGVISVFARTPEVATVKKSGRVVASNDAQIVLDLEIKGLKYAELTKAGIPGAPTALQVAFADAVRKSIASGIQGLDSSSIGLDIFDGKQDAANKHYITATATIPTPPGLSADETMSTWPGGSNAIGKRMELALRGVDGIAVAAGGQAGVSAIEVYPGPLHLGAIRATYESGTTLVFTADNWGIDTSTASTVQESEKAKFEKQLKKSLASKLALPESAIKPTSTIATGGTQLTVTATISSPNQVSDDLQSSWQTNVLAAVADVKTAWKAENQALATTGATAFTVTVILPVQITNKASGVALDFVIQGIDYNAVPEVHKHTFAADLIKELQTGVWNTFPIARGGVVATDLDVTISPGGTPASLDVTARIPISDKALADQAEQEMIRASVATGDANLYKIVQKQLANLPGLKYFSSWSSTSIKVTAPGVKVVSA